jgi:hypothetical protein
VRIEYLCCKMYVPVINGQRTQTVMETPDPHGKIIPEQVAATEKRTVAVTCSVAPSQSTLASLWILEVSLGTAYDGKRSKLTAIRIAMTGRLMYRA